MIAHRANSPAKSTAFACAMRALGRAEPPATFVLSGNTFRRSRIVKHDFWAATAFYDGDDGTQAVAKINRAAPFCGISLEWVGRWLCRHEVRFYSSLRHVPNVPALLGRLGNTGFIHVFVPGRPLAKGMALPDSFFPELRQVLAEIHRRRIAYVDSNKRENILVGDDGRPHLIDFQISYDLHDFGDWFLTRNLLHRLQAADRYHILKHQRRLRPDTLSAEQRVQATQIGGLIKLHRLITRPYFAMRRPIMKKLRDAGYLLPEGSK